MANDRIDRKVLDFDVHALFRAMDERRQQHGLSWTGIAREMWDLSAELNARDHATRSSVRPS